MKERKNVYQLPADDKTLEWYSKAVIEMKKRPTDDPRSWNYQAAVHGFNDKSPFWQDIGRLPKDIIDVWNRCQHASWFFLPWHRMYLAHFEEIVAQTIIDLGGPSDWTLPFWDYSDASNPDALSIPPVFTSPANETNSLWMKGRRTNKIDDEFYVSLKPLDTIPYTGDGITNRFGFGGPVTLFSPSGKNKGDLEANIHDNVHGVIGGPKGAMGSPSTAGLDPIFWLHHANIDRLWQVWINMGSRFIPTKAAWLDFPFILHDKNGNKVEMKCSEVVDTRRVLSGYTYQDVAPVAPTRVHELEIKKTIDFSMPLEVVAATNKRVTLSSNKTKVRLKLTPPPKKKANFALTNEAIDKPQTTMLHFENVTGKGVPPIQKIYLNVPEDGGDKQSYFAGSISLFGLEEASTPGLHHSGSGQRYALDITELINKLRALPNWKEKQLDITIEPAWEMDKDSNVKIGRISLYSE